MTEPINPEALSETLAALWSYLDHPAMASWDALRAGAGRLFAVPEHAQRGVAVSVPGGPFQPHGCCPKCGQADATVAYHRNGNDCGYHYRAEHWNDRPGEHLHRHCGRCHYEWVEQCVSAGAQS